MGHAEWIQTALQGHGGRAHGLDHVATVLQGIDPRLFRPSSRIGLLPGRFTIFSGGKLEYRMGQDIVVAAFRKFRERRPDALLAVAWQNWGKSHNPSAATVPNG